MSLLPPIQNARAKDLHAQAMSLYQNAIMQRSEKGEFFYLEQIEKAFDLEHEAVKLLTDLTDAEPTRAFIFRTAAVLAFESQKFEIALKLVQSGLAGHPPDYIRQDLLLMENRLIELLNHVIAS